MDAIVNEKRVVVAAGLDFEARLAQGPGIAVVYGQSRCKYREHLHNYAQAGVCGFISFGVAGGLSPSLRPGDVIVASTVITAGGISRTCAQWSNALLSVLPGAHHMPVFGAEDAVMTVLEKEALWSATGAAAVDVESGPVAEVAGQYGLPYTVLRVVLDPAHRALPLSAMAGAREDGKTDPMGVLKALLKRPADLPALLRLADDARKAKRSLLRSREALGPLLGFVSLEASEFALNVE